MEKLTSETHVYEWRQKSSAQKCDIKTGNYEKRVQIQDIEINIKLRPTT